MLPVHTFRGRPTLKIHTVIDSMAKNLPPNDKLTPTRNYPSSRRSIGMPSGSTEHRVTRDSSLRPVTGSIISMATSSIGQENQSLLNVALRRLEESEVQIRDNSAHGNGRFGAPCGPHWPRRRSSQATTILTRSPDAGVTLQIQLCTLLPPVAAQSPPRDAFGHSSAAPRPVDRPHDTALAPWVSRVPSSSLALKGQFLARRFGCCSVCR